jgi:hypothetical protein
MTIALGLMTYEGAVLATDSNATVYNERKEHVRTFLGVQKIFEIGPVLPRFVPAESFSGGISTYGTGKFGPISYRELVNGFYLDVIRPDPAMANVGDAFLNYIQAEWIRLKGEKLVGEKDPLPETGFYVASVSQWAKDVECTQIDLRGPKPQIAQMGKGTFSCGMGLSTVSRVLNGFDMGMEDELRRAQLSLDDLERRYQLLPELDAMPLRDGIDYLHFLVYTAAKLQQYGHRKGIGGAIEIATVTVDRGFRWVSHKDLAESVGIREGGL